MLDRVIAGGESAVEIRGTYGEDGSELPAAFAMTAETSFERKNLVQHQ
jgi:hypothetical protein